MGSKVAETQAAGAPAAPKSLLLVFYVTIENGASVSFLFKDLSSSVRLLKDSRRRHTDTQTRTPRSSGACEAGELREDACPCWGDGRGPALRLELPLLVPAPPHAVGPCFRVPSVDGGTVAYTPDSRWSERVHRSMRHCREHSVELISAIFVTLRNHFFSNQ